MMQDLTFTCLPLQLWYIKSDFSKRKEKVYFYVRAPTLLRGAYSENKYTQVKTKRFIEKKLESFLILKTTALSFLDKFETLFLGGI